MKKMLMVLALLMAVGVTSAGIHDHPDGTDTLGVRTASSAAATEQQFGLLFTKAPEIVEVGKVGMPLDVQPDIGSECTPANWSSCGATCGGIAFGCTRIETWIFDGCFVWCQWHVIVKLSCTCP